MKINVKIENQTYEVIVGDLNARPIIATIDGQNFEVTPEVPVRVAAAPQPVIAPVAPVAAVAPAPVAAPAPAPVAAQPAAASGGKSMNAVLAPIPGVIINISVKEGDMVKKGQELIVLEAMKMKNSIRAQRDGKVTSIKVRIGDHVTHSQALLELGD